MKSAFPESRHTRVVRWQRRAEVLTQPNLPCLAGYYALNVTAGCPNECHYCYAQTYAHHPGWGTVAFYGNLLPRLREELPQMKEKPRLGRYRPPFQGHGEKCGRAVPPRRTNTLSMMSD